MASLFHHLLLIFLSLHVLFSTFNASSLRPRALVLPLSKDLTTNQYTLKLTQRTPPTSLPLTLHLGGQFLWLDCDKNYVSTTYHPSRCNSAQCALANSKSCGNCNAPPRPGCNNNTCTLFPQNPFTNTASVGDLGSDVVRVTSTDGSNPTGSISVPKFLFSCAPTSLLKGLAKGVQGTAGLGRTKISLPSQFSSTFNFPKKFAICLSQGGVMFFGDGPYNFLHVPQPLDVSSMLVYTPLINNPSLSTEFFIGVTSIQIGGNNVPINKALLSIDNQGNGGTKISTINPYTLMQTPIYKSFTQFFDNQMKSNNAMRVKSVAPFELCYNGSTIPATRVGAGVPFIDLVLHKKDVTWTITGSNSMVQVNDEVLCLGFLDGGIKPKTAIVIGGFQMEDNLVQFDLVNSRVGISGTLFFSQTTCANFNFTSSA